MNYYDIHKHHNALYSEDNAIISVDIRKPFVPCAFWYSVGVHPWFIDFNDTETTDRLFKKVRKYAQLPAVVAIGETGLDKMTAITTDEYQFQQALFTSHAHLAEEVKKPLIIHCVRAWNELIRIHQTVSPTMPLVVHGFRGKEQLASRLLNAGLYLSFGMHYSIDSLNIAWENNRLLIETDDNQISIKDVYHKIADDLTISEQTLSDEIENIFVGMNIRNAKTDQD